MTNFDTTRLRELHDKATPGEWFVNSCTGEQAAESEPCCTWLQCRDSDDAPESEDDVHLIAAMRNALPGLLDALDAAQAEVERQARQVDEGGKEWSRMATEHDTLLGKANAMDDWKARAEKAERQLDAVKALADEWERDEAYACVNPHECLRCITAQRAVIRIRATITDTEKGADRG